MIELRELSRAFGGAVAVDRLSLLVAPGELLVLVGASGCGKTTTLKMINRLVEPSSGSVWIDGENAADLPGHELRRRIGYGFQQVGLFPHLTVGENVAIVPQLVGWDAERIDARIDALLELVRLDPGEFRERDPATLSGGQRQRVGLARALAAEPKLVLLDEPFGALDPLTRDHLQQELLRIRRELGLTLVFVTHDMGEALLLADRIAVLDAGRLVRVGTPRELLAEPGDERVAELLATPRRQLQRIDELLGRGETP
ncbi:MAG: ABC transporter ATP-binding protein [Myxococcota bacterium]|nr:ABC transporter ATP-binding protein [Myxococcota bacterium]